MKPRSRYRWSLARQLLAVAGTLVLIDAAQAVDEFDLLDINEGELRFLASEPAEPPHLQSTHIWLTQDSLQTGWITMQQCHYHLAPVGAMQVVFNKDRVRGLKILQADNIGQAWVEGPSVQLKDVGKDAALCIHSMNRSFQRNGKDGSYEWRGGPYMRRFLDGYFPMHVKVAIDYPARELQLKAIEPTPLRLKAVTQPGHVRMDALFEGRLTINVRFTPTANADADQRRDKAAK